MNFNRWIKKLRREIKMLPTSEQQTVLGYYEELYNDKREMGISEREIVGEFGSPDYAASKILDDAYVNARAKRQSRTGKRVLIVLAVLLFAIPIFCAVVAIGATILGLLAACIGIVAAGVWGLVVAVAAMILGGPWLLYLGMGFGLLGLGILGSILMIKFFKLLGKGIKTIFRGRSDRRFVEVNA